MSAPRIARAFVRCALPPEDRDAMCDELDALYEERVREQGAASATRWYYRQAASFALRIVPSRFARRRDTADAIATDLRRAIRAFARFPGQTAAFVATLAIGTGVLTTVYGAARWVLLRPVPGVAAPDELVTMRLVMKTSPVAVAFSVSHPDFVTLHDRLLPLVDLAAIEPIDVDLRAKTGSPRRVSGEMVSANFLSVLGAKIIAGRSFTASDEHTDDAATGVVVSASLAAELAGDARSAIGRVVDVNGNPVTVVGVVEPGFRGEALPGKYDLWLPLSAAHVIDPSRARGALAERGEGTWRLFVGRPRAGVSMDAIATAANGVIGAVRREFTLHSYPVNDFLYRAYPGVGLDQSVRASTEKTLALLGMIAALLLALSGANLANLAVARAAASHDEVAIRIALGSGRGRIIRQSVVETLMLGVLGGCGGVALSAMWLRWFNHAQLAERGASLAGAHVDARTIAGALAVAMAVALLASIGSAIGLAHQPLDAALRRAATAVRGRTGARMTLVATQVALSVVLLVSAGLLVRTVANLRKIDLGFDPSRILTFAIDPSVHGYDMPTLSRLTEDLERDFSNIGGVTGAGFAEPSPLESGYVTAALYPYLAKTAPVVVGAGFYVSPGFLRMIGARFIAGDSSWKADSGTVVISRLTAEKLFPGELPAQIVGRVVPTRRSGKFVRIAGIIENLQLSAITAPPPPLVFRSLHEAPAGLPTMAMIASRERLGTLVRDVGTAAERRAPDLPVFNVRTAREAVDLQFAERGVMARAAATLGVLGIVLTVVGLYGVLAHIVAARQREIGIRSALGASPLQIARRVVASGLIPGAIGIAAGIAGSIGVARLLRAQLYGLGAADTVSYVLSVATIAVAIGLACLLPAVRAARLSPARVLRGD